MSTGLVDKWNGADLAEFGAIYPFVGSEVFWYILCVAVWLGFHVWQAMHERKQFEESKASLKDPEHLKWALRQDTLHGAVTTNGGATGASRGASAAGSPKGAAGGDDNSPSA